MVFSFPLKDLKFEFQIASDFVKPVLYRSTLIKCFLSLKLFETGIIVFFI